MLRPLAAALLVAFAVGCSQTNGGTAGSAGSIGTTGTSGTTGGASTTTAATGTTSGATTAGSTTTTSTSGSTTGGLHDGGADAGTDGGPTQGILVGGTGPYPGPIAGVHYRSTTQSGFTSDAGAFTYLPGETVTFSVADVDFTPTPGAPYVSPWQLVTQQTCAPSAELTNLLVLLYSLDDDGTAANGTQVPQAGPSGTQRTFSTLSAASIQALIAQLLPGGLDGGVAVDAGDPIDGGQAVIDFITQMDNEIWQQVSLSTFTSTGALYRSQGVSTDGTNFYFSWQFGFDKTDLTYTSLEHNAEAIPTALVLDYDDHIGDNDYWDGGIYAGVEDDGTGETTAYQHPHIATWDTNLNYVNSWSLSDTLMTDGVPWVGVDGPNGHLLSSNYGTASAIYLFDLGTAAYLSSIPLSQPLHSVQGAKLFEGSLYASCFDSPMTIAKIDMATGVVIVLWDMTNAVYALPSGAEEEGCVFLPMSDGSMFHTIDNDKNQASVEMRHHQRIRDPLRKSVCP